MVFFYVYRRRRNGSMPQDNLRRFDPQGFLNSRRRGCENRPKPLVFQRETPLIPGRDKRFNATTGNNQTYTHAIRHYQP